MERDRGADRLAGLALTVAIAAAAILVGVWLGFAVHDAIDWIAGQLT